MQSKQDASIAGYGSRTHTVRGGTTMKWAEMSTRHLRNAADWMVSHAEDEVDAISRCSFQGEMAQDMQTSALSAAFDREFVAKTYAREMRAYADWREANEIEAKGRGKEFSKWA